jgi:hypothetical protein
MPFPKELWVSFEIRPSQNLRRIIYSMKAFAVHTVFSPKSRQAAWSTYSGTYKIKLVLDS